MKRSRETGNQAVTTPSVSSMPSINNTDTIPLQWLKLHEQAKKASEEESFLLKWNMMRHLFEQEEMPFDILIGVVGPLFIDLITLKTIQGTVLRLYEPIVLVMTRTRGSDLSFFHNNQRYTIRKSGSYHVQVRVHCHPESEEGYTVDYCRETSLLRRVDDVFRMVFTDAQNFQPPRLGEVFL